LASAQNPVCSDHRKPLILLPEAYSQPLIGIRLSLDQPVSALDSTVGLTSASLDTMLHPDDHDDLNDLRTIASGFPTVGPTLSEGDLDA
jgi:hypothetical protein